MTRYVFTTLALFVGVSVSSACELCTVPGWSTAKNGTKAGTKDNAKKVEKTAKQKRAEATAHKVFKHLANHMKPVDGMLWPPSFEVVEESFGMKYNAVAWCDRNGEGDVVLTDGRATPHVEFTQGYLDILEGNEDAIAVVIGHELGHHALGHSTRKLVLKSFPKIMIDGHRMEADADLFGAKLALEAGYSVRNGLRIEWKGLESLGGNVGPAGAVSGTHPGTSDRAARVLAVLDDPEAALWRKMAAFENGAKFIAIGDYAAAEAAFTKAVAEFPECHEAWANLGIAQLMQYCKALSPSAIRRLGLGHFIGPAHYPTAASLTRSSPAEIWTKAIATLERANKLKAGQPITLANLGLAYLVHPSGQGKGLEEAKKYLGEAREALKVVEITYPQIELALLVNLGVSHIAAGETEKGRKMLAVAEELAEKLYYNKWARKSVVPPAILAALRFNQAAAMEHENKAAAAGLYEEYLKNTPKNSPWWPVAYDRYESLSKDAGNRAKSKDDLGATTLRQRQLVVTLPNGKEVHLGESMSDVLKDLGQPTAEVKHPSSTVRALTFEKHGIQIIADQDEVFAVVIISPKGPTITVQEAGPTGKKLGELKVGMTQDEVQELLGGPGVMSMFSDLRKEYPYFADLGVAVVYDKNGVVTSLIVGYLSTDYEKK